MSKLDKVSDEVMELSLDEKEILAQILKQKIIENRRQQIAEDAQISLTEFQQGKYQPFTPQEAINNLREYLSNLEQEKRNNIELIADLKQSLLDARDSKTQILHLV